MSAHDFVMEWPQYIFQNRCGHRYVLDKGLNEIEEVVHEENVRKKIESKKYTLVDAKDKFNMPERKTREEIRKEEDDAKWRTQIEFKQDFLQFQFFSDFTRRDLMGGRAITKKESDFPEDENVPENIREMERANVEPGGGAWGGSMTTKESRRPSNHIYEKPLNYETEYESTDEGTTIRSKRFQGRGFQIESFPKAKQSVSLRMERSDDSDEARAMAEFSNFSSRDHFNPNIQRRSEFLDDDSLRLGHRKNTEVVDTIRGVISDAVTRMDILQRRKEPQHKDHQKEQLTSTEEEDEDDEILDRSHNTFTPSKKKWSPQKDSILQLVGNNRQDGKEGKKKEERKEKGLRIKKEKC